MSTTALDELVREERALIAALDADDVAAIARHSETVGQAIGRLRDAAAHHDEALAREALDLAEAARVRINVLADMTARRLTRLAAATGVGAAAPTYGRDARLKR